MSGNRPGWAMFGAGHLFGGGRGIRSFLAVLIVAYSAIVGVPSGGAIPNHTVAAVKLSATALVMAGTNQILSIPPNTSAFITSYINHTYTDFIAPSGLCIGGSPGCALVAVYTPEQFRPFTGFTDMTLDESVAVGRANLDNCIRGIACTVTPPPYTDTDLTAVTDTSYLVFGESQSANISTYEKAYLIAHPPVGTAVSFDLVSNPNRPNGGLLERFVGAFIPFIGITFNGATPTNSPTTAPLTTVDVARQYDGWADFPTNPLNVLAVLNSILGAGFYHSAYRDIDAPAQLQGYFQDTTYFLERTALVPLLEPLARIPFVGLPLAVALDAPLRVLVETGYDRTINPGQPTPARYLYFPDPIRTLINFAVAIPTGWDDAIAFTTADPTNRPFRTAPQPVYGVGGPPVYAGAVDPYGPVDPAVTAAAADTNTPVNQREIGLAGQRRAPSTAGAPRVRLAPQLSRERKRAAAVHPPSSKIATARVQPADAA